MWSNCGGGYFLAQNFAKRNFLNGESSRTVSDNWLSHADTSWEGSGTADDPYQISSAEELAGIAAAGSHFQDTYFTQTANINLGGKMWTSIGGFWGTFDGAGYSISGMFIDTTGDYAGLFSTTWRAGLYNIKLKNSVLKTSGHGAGGIVGNLEWGRAIDCSSDCLVMYVGTAIGTGESIGGVIGHACYGATIESCVNYGKVKSDKNIADVGGVVGYIDYVDANTGSTTVTDCINYGEVENAGFYTGGIAGSINKKTVVKGCHNYGNVTANEQGAGGIVGYMDDCTIKECVNDAMICSKDYVGLILGSTWSESGTAIIENCEAKGCIYIENDESYYAGGILGGLPNTNKPLIIKNCSVIATGNDYFSPVYGGPEGTNTTVDSCYSNINNSFKTHSSGDFSDFGIVDGINDGLPILRTLYFAARFAPSFSTNWFTENGYQ